MARYKNDAHGSTACRPAMLLICPNQGLIGQEMFAIDGVKLPGNASKRKSGP